MFGEGGWKEGLLAIWEFCGGYCFYTHRCGCTVKCLCARKEENHFCLEYLLYFLNSLIIYCLTLPKISLFLPPPPPPTPPFNYQVVLHFVSIDSFQLVSMLQGLPYICLVHHIAVVNPHVLLFPWILN